MRFNSIATLLLPVLLCGCAREPGLPIYRGIPGEEFTLIRPTPRDSCFEPLENYCGGGTRCESYARARERMRVDENDRECGSFFAASGTCGAFTFIAEGDGLTSRTMYFDPTGSVIAVRLSSDAIDQECGGWSYFGPRVTCEEVVTRRYCRQLRE